VSADDQPIHSSVVIDVLKQEVSRLERLWDCEINFQTVNPKVKLPAEIADGVRLIMSESVANAVLHGRARNIEIDLFFDRDLKLRIQDDGTGLSNAHGTYDHATLSRHELGPKSIRRRTERLGGVIRLESTANGLILDISLPGDGTPTRQP
jgi:signal transduction histidine kinase